MMSKMKWVVCLIAGLSFTSVWAQEKDSPADTADHTQHNGSNIPAVSIPEANEGSQTMQGMDNDAMPGMPESGSGMDPETQSNTIATQKQDMGGMDNGNMNMQGSSALPEVRDPHAYSGGYTLGSGNYALPGPRQLHLADEHNFGAIVFNRLEYLKGKTTTYDTQAWYGRTYDRLVLKGEGNVSGGDLEKATTELLWGHSVAAYWDTQLGVRYDNGAGPDRGWLALGIQGLAPYWFEVDAAAYLGDKGRTAITLAADYELLITQKLVLRPSVEVSFYGKRDQMQGVGRGFSKAQAGLRLRYEFTRQFAPYIGIEWAGKFGETADFARIAGGKARETRWIAGVRFWF